MQLLELVLLATTGLGATVGLGALVLLPIADVVLLLHAILPTRDADHARCDDVGYAVIADVVVLPTRDTTCVASVARCRRAIRYAAILPTRRYYPRDAKGGIPQDLRSLECLLFAFS